MIRHHLRIAWRQIRNHPMYSSIHVLGLSIGICACTVIWLIARYDLGFDKFHPDADRIYRIVGDIRMPDGSTMFLNCPPQLAELEHGIPGFEQEVGFHTFGSTITIPAGNGRPEQDFSTKPDRRYGTSVILTGPSFFHLFPHQWVAGGPGVLNEPNRIVLTEDAARRYFGDVPTGQLIGRTLIVDDSLPLTVSGIVRDWVGLSDLDYTSFISISTAPNSWVKNQFPTADWGSLLPHQSQAFVKLAKGVRPEQVNAELAAFITKRHPVPFPGTSHMHLYLQQLFDMHYSASFRPGDTGDDFPQAYLPLLYALMGVAVFILLLAVINFVNLTTAQSLQRVKEVGIRKIMGSSRRGLVWQFLMETLLLAFGAVVLSALMVRPALHLFAIYIPYGLEFRVLDGGNLFFLFAIMGITTLIAGVYPARLMSGYLPVTSLKGSTDKGGTGGSVLRKSLIVFQFSISLIFIIGSLVIGRQIRFMRDADKGFSSDAIMTVNRWHPKPGQLQLFAQRVRGLAGVRDVVLQGNSPMGWAHAGETFIFKGKAVKEEHVMIQGGDAGFIPFYGMRIVAGRNMLTGDSVREVVINEACAHDLGFAQAADAVGNYLYRKKDSTGFAIAGVVADFHEDSFHETIKPLVIINEARAISSVGIKLATMGRRDARAAKTAIAAIEKEWKGIFPKTPFAYSFLSESITWLYGEETNTASLMGVAVAITVAISCMGLFGLVVFTAGRRSKEIGIRKVLGATVVHVVLLLSRDFILLIGLALLIASPVAWWLADMWLDDFAYKVPMSVWVLIEAGMGALGLALLTVGWQAVRAARAKPVETLRSE